MPMRLPSFTLCVVAMATAGFAPPDHPRFRNLSPADLADADQDGLPNGVDRCPDVVYVPGFASGACGPMDLDPGNDAEPACKARERVLSFMASTGVFTTDIAFAVVRCGELHFADAFSYIGGGQYIHNPDGVRRLYRIGSTSKPVVAVTARIMEECGELSLEDYVNDEDASQLPAGGQRTLRDLLSQRGAFRSDAGHYRTFCYPGDLAAYWSEPDETVSPEYDSTTYGNLGGGFAYSAFNYSLAGAYLANRAGEPFAQTVQTRLFDAAGMCTATFDGARATSTSIGDHYAYSQTAVGDIGPAINLYSPADPYCEDNFYTSDDLYGDPYTWQAYRLDEAAAEARDPAGGVIASVIDMARFAETLLASYHGTGGVLTQAGVRDVWSGLSEMQGSFAAYGNYYALGFFTDVEAGSPVSAVGHAGGRAGYNSGFELRPEANMAVVVLVNANVSGSLSQLARDIMDDFAGCGGCPGCEESVEFGGRRVIGD